jgi:hypothetical protein
MEDAILSFSGKTGFRKFCMYRKDDPEIIEKPGDTFYHY